MFFDIFSLLSFQAIEIIDSVKYWDSSRYMAAHLPILAETNNSQLASLS